MTISQDQYVDLLVKKLYGVATTDNATNKSPSNESIPSPELNRGDTVWTQANQIPNVAANIANLSFQYANSNPIQCVPDTTSVPIRNSQGQLIYPTWLTNVTEWIPQQFGASYSVSAYVGPANIANLSTGNVTFISSNGEGGSYPGEYYFDYQAGLLYFIGETIPNVLTSGNVVYITGYTYTGLTGVTNLPDNSNIGNITIANTTFSSNNANLIAFGGTGGVGIPAGNTAQQPGSPVIGTTRFNTTSNSLETWSGSTWVSGGGGNVITPGSIVDQQITPDGIANTFTLTQSTTSSGVLVAINGVNQLPNVAYTVSGNSITFSQTPLTQDLIDVRFVTYFQSVSSLSSGTGNASVTITPAGNINFTTSNVTSAILNTSGTLDISSGKSLKLPSYTVAQASNIASPSAGQVIYVSNGNAGNPSLAVYDGTSWKRIALGTTISAS
jgi:hypothetical protein